MEKLIKPAEYAQELGISRQAVYAKIKRGILPSKNVDGKLYIVVDNIETPKETIQKPKVAPPKETPAQEDVKDYKSLLKAKDETISVLKGTVKDLKKSNKQISTTLRGEIDLLKDAFYEMRTLYVKQLEYKKAHENEEVIEVDSEESIEWISVKKFFKQNGITKEKQQDKLMKRFKKALKRGDTRLQKSDGKLKFDPNKSYEDFLG